MIPVGLFAVVAAEEADHSHSDADAKPAVLFERARVRRTQGRLDEAVQLLHAVGRLAPDTDPAILPWRSELAHALIDLDDGGEAAAATLADAEVEIAREFGTATAIAAALRALARAREDVAPLREAAALLEDSPSRLERARVLSDLGAALRRADENEEARDTLRVAVELAHRCGARDLEDAALAELRAAGARPRRLVITGPGSLTKSERRIASLAAAGLMNRDIADELVVTLQTVEFHLRNAYRKLSIKSRTELVAAGVEPARRAPVAPVLALAA